jgi:hypothetical protein
MYARVIPGWVLTEALPPRSCLDKEMMSYAVDTT